MVAGVRDLLTQAIHPVSASRQQFNNILFGDFRLSQLCHLIENITTPDEIQEALLHLQALRDDPSQFGIKEGLPREFLRDFNRELARVEALERKTKQDFEPLLRMLGRYCGVVPNLTAHLRQALKESLDRSVTTSSSFLADLIANPEPLNQLLAVLPASIEGPSTLPMIKTRILEWERSLDGRSLQATLFDRADLSAEEHQLLIDCQRLLADCRTDNPLPYTPALRQALHRLIVKRTGTVKKTIQAFESILMRSLSCLEDHLRPLDPLITTLFNDLKNLRDQPQTSSRSAAFQRALAPFIRDGRFSRARLQHHLMQGQTATPDEELACRRIETLLKQAAREIDSSTALHRTLTTLEEELEAFCLLRMGMIARIPYKIERIIAQEKRHGPLVLRQLFLSLTRFESKASSEEHQRLLDLIASCGSTYPECISLSQLHLSMQRHDTISPALVLEAKREVAHLLAKQQGLLLTLTDQIKSELCDRRDGLLPLALGAVTDGMQERLLKQLPPSFSDLYQCACVFKKTRSGEDFTALETALANYVQSKEFITSDWDLTSLDRDQFDDYFHRLCEKKKHRQGLLHEAFDSLKLKIDQAVPPMILSMMSGAKAHGSKISMLDRALLMIESFTNNGIKNGLIYFFSSLQDWMKKTQSASLTEEAFFSEFFSSTLARIQACDFSNREQRHALTAHIRQIISRHPIMIDQILSLPISAADEEVEPADPAELEALSRLEKISKVTQKKPVSESTSVLADRFSQTASFYAIYAMSSRLMGFDTGSLQLENDTKIASLKRQTLTAQERNQAYAEWQGEQQFNIRNLHSFKMFMEGIGIAENPQIRFMELLKDKILRSGKKNLIYKHFLAFLVPHLHRLFLPIAHHLTSRSIDLMMEISQLSATDPSKKIHTGFIRSISGYFNRIDELYRQMPERLGNQSIVDFMKKNLKTQFSVGGDTFTLRSLISLLNHRIVSAFFPRLSLSTYVDSLIQVLADFFHQHTSTTSDWLKTAIILPAVMLLKLINFLLIRPLEFLFNKLGSYLIWKTLDLFRFTEKLLESIFNELKDSTGLYHLIREPLSEVLEGIDFDDELPQDPAIKAILCQQDSAKRDLDEMYRSMKVCVSWFSNAISKNDVLRIMRSESKDPTQQSLQDRMISSIEVRFLSDMTSEAFLSTIHHITQAAFVEEKLIKKGLMAGIKWMKESGHVLSMPEKDEKMLKLTSSETTFQKLSDQAMSKILDKIIRKALSDLGANQKLAMDQFIRFINTHFQSISIAELENFSDQAPLDKIKNLEKLLKELKGSWIQYQAQKEHLLGSGSIKESLKGHIQKKIHPVEHLLASMIPSVEQALEKQKEAYEREAFHSLRASLQEQKEAIIERLKNIQTAIESDEKVDYSSIYLELNRMGETDKTIVYEPVPFGRIELSHQSRLFDRRVKLLLQQFQEVISLLKCLDQAKEIRQVFIDHRMRLERGSPEEAALVKQQLLSLLKHLPSPYYVRLERLLETALVHPSRSFDELSESIEGLIASLTEKLNTVPFATLDFDRSSTDSSPSDSPRAASAARAIDPSFFEQLTQLKELSKEIKPIHYLSISLAEQSGLLNIGKKIVLKQLKTEVEKYKKFLNSPDTIETLFYNCVIPSVVA